MDFYGISHYCLTIPVLKLKRFIFITIHYFNETVAINIIINIFN